MKIALKPFNSGQFYGNKIFKIDTSHNIFFGFKKNIKSKGVEINTIDIAKGKSDLYVYCDVPYPWEFKRWVEIIQHTSKNILLVFESPVINPVNHLPFLKYLFKRIYTWDTTIVDDKKYFNFYIPQRNLKIESKQFEKEGLASLIISNNLKVKKMLILGRLLSRYKSLNDFRDKLVEFIINSSDCKLYGKGWGEKFANQKSFGGEVKESRKFATIGKYKFYFAIENSSAPGYITEKIFDAFRAGVVPVYLGAPNISKYIPSECFVDINKFNSIEGVMEYCDKLDHVKYEQMIKAGQKFLNSKKTKDAWFEDGFLKKFINEITE